MYEELIQKLEHAAGGPEGIQMAHDAAAAISALQAENGSKDKEIEAYEIIMKTMPAQRDEAIYRMKAAEAALSRVEAERDAAISDVPHECRTCKHKPEKYGVCGMGCEVCPLEINRAERCKWQWRGAQGEA